MVEECKNVCQEALDKFKEEAKDYSESVWDLKCEYEEGQTRARKERADL